MIIKNKTKLTEVIHIYVNIVGRYDNEIIKR